MGLGPQRFPRIDLDQFSEMDKQYVEGRDKILADDNEPSKTYAQLATKNNSKNLQNTKYIANKDTQNQKYIWI